MCGISRERDFEQVATFAVVARCPDVFDLVGGPLVRWQVEVGRVGAAGAVNAASVAIAALSVRFVGVDVTEVGAGGVEEAERAACFRNVPFDVGELT